jgi:caffeoyl-CoA O-methyltransferase
MEFLPIEIEKYALTHSDEEPEVLKKLNRETYSKVLMPRMLSGHLQGRLLSMFSKMIQPKTILEIGTYTGYSAICLAEGLQPDGKIITIDINEELEDLVRKYFKESGIEKQADYRIGNAMQIIPTLTETFDLVFIDADKENYINYFNLVFDKVKPGGYIIADNVLWSGKVLGDYDKLDKDTKTIVDFNKKITEDTRVENLLLPVRDGLMVVRKK